MKKKRPGNNQAKPTSHKTRALDDLRPEYDFSLSRPNSYAHRPKNYRGGARAGSGRKPVAKPMERHTITMHPSDVNFLRSLDANLSKAVRRLIAKAR